MEIIKKRHNSRLFRCPDELYEVVQEERERIARNVGLPMDEVSLAAAARNVAKLFSLKRRNK